MIKTWFFGVFLINFLIYIFYETLTWVSDYQPIFILPTTNT